MFRDLKLRLSALSDKQLIRFYLFASFLVLVVALFSHLDVIGLRAEEPRRAMVGIEALEFDSWWVPTIHNETYYNKPPFYNWVLAASFWVTQSYSEWAVRLPGVLSFLATALLLFFLVRKYENKELAALSALAYLCSADLLFYGSVNAGEIDLFYSFITLIQVFSIFHFFQKGKWFYLFFASYFFAALGVLTKGLPSIAFQGLTLIPFLLIKRKASLLFAWQHLVGILVFCGFVGGYLFVYAQHEDLAAFLTNQFKESSQRTANEYGLGKIIAQLFQFPAQLLQLILPWSIFVVLAFRKKALSTLKQRPLFSFLFFFLAANIWLYWISPEMRNRYLYMFLPVLVCLLLGLYYQCPELSKTKRMVNKIFSFLIWICPLGFFAFPFIKSFNPAIEIPLVPSLIFGSLLLLVCFTSVLVKISKVYPLILVLALTRFGFNFCWMEHFHQHSIISTYYNYVDEMLEITGDDSIFLTGQPYVFEPDIQFGGTELYRNKIETPPLLPYSIPYHFVKQGHSPLRYMKVPRGKAYFIGEVGYMPELKKNIHYRFRDSWQQRDMMLFTISD